MICTCATQSMCINSVWKVSSLFQWIWTYFTFWFCCNNHLILMLSKNLFCRSIIKHCRWMLQFAMYYYGCVILVWWYGCVGQCSLCDDMVVWGSAVCVMIWLCGAVQFVWLYGCVGQCSLERHITIMTLLCTAWQASAYARCIMLRENLKKDECSPEFRKFFSCFHKAVSLVICLNLQLIITA